MNKSQDKHTKDSSAHAHYPSLTREDVLPVLGEMSLLGGLSQNQLGLVLDHLTVQTYRKGEFVFKQGDLPGDIYVVRDGRVKIVADVDSTPMELVEYGVGQCFGEASAIAIQPHSASAVVTEDATLLVLSAHNLHLIYNEQPKVFGILILNIAREVSRRLQKADEILLHYANGK